MMIGLELIKQHFTTLGWHLCWHKHPILKRFWFEKDGLRTPSFWGAENPVLIQIYDKELSGVADKVFFDEFPLFRLEGGTVNVEMELVEWIKEVEGKWGLYRL